MMNTGKRIEKTQKDHLSVILFWVFAGFSLPILIAEQDAGVDI